MQRNKDIITVAIVSWIGHKHELLRGVILLVCLVHVQLCPACVHTWPGAPTCILGTGRPRPSAALQTINGGLTLTAPRLLPQVFM